MVIFNWTRSCLLGHVYELLRRYSSISKISACIPHVSDVDVIT